MRSSGDKGYNPFSNTLVPYILPRRVTVISPWNGKPKLSRLVIGWDHQRNSDFYVPWSKFHNNWGPGVSTSDDVVSTDVVIGPNLAHLLTLKPHFARHWVDAVCCTSISSLQPLVVIDMNIRSQGIIRVSLGNEGVAECSTTRRKIKNTSNLACENHKQWPLMKWSSIKW